METQHTNHPEEPETETPKDVATLYTWANLRGARYRDFSASRREYRAQVRYQAAEDLRQVELKAKSEAEASAIQAERAAWILTRAFEGEERSSDRDRALRHAEEDAERAANERLEAARRADTAARAEAAAKREEHEMAVAHASAERQTARWEDSETRRRALAGPQPARILLGLSAVARDRAHDLHDEASTDARRSDHSGEYNSGLLRQSDTGTRQELLPARLAARSTEAWKASAGLLLSTGREPGEAPVPTSPLGSSATDLEVATKRLESFPAADHHAPAWFYPSSSTALAQAAGPYRSSGASLQQSRDRATARWSALQAVSEPGQKPNPAHAIKKETRTPTLAVFAFAGGVGKTSLVATLGRTLSSLGEKVLLVDTSPHGLLPFYFGATELHPGVVRTFSPPSDGTDTPIHLASYDIDQSSNAADTQDAFVDRLARSSSQVHRTLLDLNANSAWMIQRPSSLNLTVLVPLAPDMSSLISLQRVEKLLQGAKDDEGHAIRSFYVLNQFDASLPLHLDIREVLRRQLCERLLSFVLRHTPALSEALAEGMTVVDYSPESSINTDYIHLATWLRTISTPLPSRSLQAAPSARWSEQ